MIFILIEPKSKPVEFCGLRSTDQLFGTLETVVIFSGPLGSDHCCQMTEASQKLSPLYDQGMAAPPAAAKPSPFWGADPIMAERLRRIREAAEVRGGRG